jgi:hypothetical protein
VSRQQAERRTEEASMEEEQKVSRRLQYWPEEEE